MFKLFTATALGAIATAAIAAGPTPEISLDTLKTITQTISADDYEGRAPGTAGEEKTVKYLADRFAAAGLEPGNNGSWYQDVPLVEITADPKATLAIAGGGAPISLAYKIDMVINSYRAVPRTEIAASDIVFVGYGINAPERGWNDYAGIDVKGKTVVILINDPDYETKGLEGTFGGRAMTYYGRWTYKYEEAARQGAAAALIIHDTEPAAYPFSVVVTSNTGPQIHADAGDNGMGETQANGWITMDAAKRLFASAGKDLTALTAAAKRKGFKAEPLGLTLSTAFDNDIKRQKSRNVIGILPGKTRPDEYVLYTAHWDHLGRCEPDASGDDICNGAYDNATGTAALVALAEAHAKAGAPDRSLVFVAVTAEESGLLGSEYYAANPVYPLARTVGGINMDGINILGRTHDVVEVGSGKSELGAYLARAVAAQGRVITPEPTPEKGFYYRSDHFSLAKRGVPMLYFESGEDLVNGGKEAGAAAAADYTAKHYHQASDEYDPAWDWSGGLEDVGLFYTIGRELATGGSWPNWNQGDEFRAVRDASRAGDGSAK